VVRSRAWPTSTSELCAVQQQLAAATPPAWEKPGGAVGIGGCFVCFPRGEAEGAADAPAWAGAAVSVDARVVAGAGVSGRAGAGYEPGLLALREGPLLEAAVRALPRAPDVLLVNATGRDHPRRAGLALHLGAVLELPSIGVTHRPLLAHGEWPGGEVGDRAPLRIADELVGCWLRTRRRIRPLAVYPGWRVGELDAACAVVLAAVAGARAPEPLREARRVARIARQAG
jgi:deoxyribonuclease V